MHWPDPPTDHPLGDGRSATAADRPETREALAEAIGRRVGEGLAIYPQGGRTALDYGNPPARPGVAVDLTALDRVVDFPAADMTITVEAGLTLSALQGALAEAGQRLPLEAPEADRATLGGIFATDTSGPRRLGFGRPRDLVLGVTFATSAGELVKGGGRVVKNVAGYDFPRLLTGSMGTLGAIVELTLKTRPKPGRSAIAWSAFRSLDPIASALDRLNTSATRPVALELLNGPAARAVAEGSGLDLPVGDWVLAVGFEGTAEAVSWQLDRLGPELPDGPIGRSDVDDPDPLWRSLVDRQAAAGSSLAIKANLRPSALPGFVAALDPGRWSIQCHAGNGIVRASLLDGDPAALGPVLDRLRDLAAAADGGLILPRCPTDLKPSLNVWGRPRPDRALARRVMQALDPAGAMNPGRFL